VLVTPNNPTGAVTPPEMIREIADIAKRHDLIVISDEIYEKLVYEGNEHLSIATLPGMRERTITLNGFSKSYAMTGWRVGYMAAPEPRSPAADRTAPHALDQHQHPLAVRRPRGPRGPAGRRSTTWCGSTRSGAT
jgi:aspartate/methionine/tyrosine aminotransferase